MRRGLEVRDWVCAWISRGELLVMRLMPRMGLATIGLLGLVAIVAGVLVWPSAKRQDRAVVTDLPQTLNETPAGHTPVEAEDDSPTSTGVEVFPDPNAPGTSSMVFVDPLLFEDDISGTALRFTGLVRNERSIRDRSEAILGRVSRGLTALREENRRLTLDENPSREQAIRAIQLWRSIGCLYMYDGKFDEAATWLEKARELSRRPGIPEEDRANLQALIGINALRRGEIANCVECLGPSSCIFPIAPEAVHQLQAGSREAVKQFTAYLDEWPGDLRIRWLLNLAYMTLGEYPDKVPPAYRIPMERFRSSIDIGHFNNIATLVGLDARGPGLAGGSIFDDFNGDGLLDLFASSLDPDRGASLFVNRGDGTFEDRSSSAGLDDQVYALNVARADFDNDGNLDVLLLRGGWEVPTRLSLLRNKGGGVFEDVTVASGLDEPIATESAVWGDYDNDGWIDLFVCGEYRLNSNDFRNLCRLYHNNGDGTFDDVASEAGVTNNRFAKGSAWGDYDGDGLLDLFVSNMCMGKYMPSRLYHNEGNGRFRDVAEEVGIKGSEFSFSCMFWDYDNDGRLDLYVSDYGASLAEAVAGYMGLPVRENLHPRLYRNLGKEGFREVSAEVRLNRPLAAMSVNIGDIDNDGYLDLYLGTGWMTYSGLIPNVLLKNVDGERFEDVTDASGTGHLQKGHGISFGDWDCDGDQDIFVVHGGGYPGDKAFNALFQNPGHGRHWLKIKLEGTRTNRAALGARIQVDLKSPDGSTRSIYRVIGDNGSFGGNSLFELIGLLDAPSVDRLTVTWPASKTTQTFRNIAADQFLVITEGNDSYTVRKQPVLSPPRTTTPVESSENAE